MELLDRYLHAVKFWLPRQQQDDIIAEISEDLRSQIEEREHQLGRSLNENEIAELLRRRGRPLLVANGYLPQQALIGPILFPIFILVLKIAVLCSVIPRLLVLIGFFIFDPKYRMEGLGVLIGRTWSELWFGMFVTFGIVTLIFAIIERTQEKSRWLEKWDPLKLPKVKDTRRIPRRFVSVRDCGRNHCSHVVDRTGIVGDPADQHEYPYRVHRSWTPVRVGSHGIVGVRNWDVDGESVSSVLDAQPVSGASCTGCGCDACVRTDGKGGSVDLSLWAKHPGSEVRGDQCQREHVDFPFRCYYRSDLRGDRDGGRGPVDLHEDESCTMGKPGLGRGTELKLLDSESLHC